MNFIIKFFMLFIISISPQVVSTKNRNIPILHLANQNKLPELMENKSNSNTSVLFDTFVIGGFGLKAGKKETFDNFIKADLPMLEKNFKKYLIKYGQKLTPTFQGSLLLDIEHPIHLIKLSSIPKIHLKGYIKAINLRASMIKRFFPLAQVGLYGLFVPYQKCGYYKADKNRLASFRLGLENGILNNVDFFTVVSYLRWKPDSIDINQCIARKISLIDVYAKNHNTPYRPLLSLRLYNKKSPSDRQFVNYKNPKDKLFNSLLSQVKIFKNAGIKDIIIYHPNANLLPKNDSQWSQSAAVSTLNSYLQK